MTSHWRLAIWVAALAAIFSLLAAAAVGYLYGGPYVAAFLYGAGVGVLSFTSIAITASLLGGRLSGDRILLGLAAYVGRLIFAGVAIGVPLYLETWPAVSMVGGFAGVYVLENVMLLVGAAKVSGAYRRGATGVDDRNGG